MDSLTLGQGTYGEVIGKDATTAVKITKPMGADHIGCCAWREILALQSLPPHPHMVRLQRTDIDLTHQPFPQLSLFLDRFDANLYTVLATKIEFSLLPLTWFRWRLCLDLALGVQHLHSHHLVHRDIKSMNTLVKFDPTSSIRPFSLAICDLGQSCWVSSMPTERNFFKFDDDDEEKILYESKTPRTSEVTTLPYRPPELFSYENRTNSLVLLKPLDIWSLGCVFYEIWACKKNAEGQLYLFAYEENDSNRSFQARQAQILKEEKEIRENMENERASDLILSMIQMGFRARPKIEKVIKFIETQMRLIE